MLATSAHKLMGHNLTHTTCKQKQEKNTSIKKETSIRSGPAQLLCAQIGSVNDQKRTNKAKFQVEFNVIPGLTGQPKQGLEHSVHPVVL